MCGQVMRHAVVHGLAEHNPAADIKPSDVLKPAKKTNHARLSEKELPELLRKIDGYDGQPLTRLAMQLMALTFVRTGELIGARWDEIDLTKKEWRIPAERMKRGSSCSFNPEIVGGLLIGVIQVFTARFVLDQQVAFPQPVDVAVAVIEFFDFLLETADAPRSDAEHMEKLDPERLGVGVFRFRPGPFAGKRQRVVFDFVPGECHAVSGYLQQVKFVPFYV